MRSAVAVLAAAAGAAALPQQLQARQSSNPFEGRSLYVNPRYSESLEETRQAFLDAGDSENAGKVQFVQESVGSFVWISNIASLEHIDIAIETAREVQASTGSEQIVGLVLYNLPDRDCSAGESAGELELDQDGLNRYKSEYVDEFAARVQAATDLHFAVVVEPDAIGNMVTGQDLEFCANAREPQQEGMGYAIDRLQGEHISLYLDAANGGWLGWGDNLAPTAEEFSNIMAQASSNSTIRGFATNVSNYNPFVAEVREDYTEGSDSYDESNYATTLAAVLEASGLPTNFIIDQGRVGVPGAREEWGDWCNIEAGFGPPTTTDTDNPLVDALVWIKPGGESDGECGMEGAPIAGAWFDEYAQLLTVNAHPDIVSVSSSN